MKSPSMEGGNLPSLNTIIDWKNLNSNEEVKTALENCISECNISSLKDMPKEDIAQLIVDHIVEKGYTEKFSISVSDSDESGNRKTMGMAHSPIDGSVLHF
ncbi:MAG: hypothetical protein KBC67_02980 [Candidatus Pacebacteria bacterium]|nr:hypothetical protein [Candidatus Paceibacterota bacterium]